MHPWEHTLAELRAAGKLSNGEQLPSLEDFIKEVKKETCCTRLWLDIKNITYPATLTEHAIAATRRSCEIAAEMGAKHFVEFICTGNATVMKSSLTYARAAGIPIGWMNNRSAGEYATLGYDWANLAAPHMCAEAGGKGARTIEEFEKEGIVLSVYNIDRQAGDGNAVYASEAIDYYCQNAKRFKALCTNYPKWLIAKIEQAAKVYDGIRSEADLQAFAAEVVVDPTAKRFQNAAGAVVLHNDITVAGAWRPLADFTGVFDGNGKTLTVNYSGSDEQAGIFATLNGTVKNLRVAGSFTTAATAKVSLGAIAGVLGETAQIVGCVNTAAIAMDVDAERHDHHRRHLRQGHCGVRHRGQHQQGNDHRAPQDPERLGGRGRCRRLRLLRCLGMRQRGRDPSFGRGIGQEGHVCGRWWLGRLDAGKGYVVENCRNEAPVTLATAQVANNLLGGVVAYANGENNDTPNTIRNCENRGHVLADAPVSETANVGKARMGGICGGSAIFTSCTNYGAVEARGGGKGATEFAIGGISGMIAHDAADCRNFGDVLNNTGKENILAHTGGLFGWATLDFTIEGCALDADVVSTTLYNYDGDKGLIGDPTHENSSCAGILVGRIKSKIVVTVKSAKIHGKMTRTINAEGQTKVVDFTTTVPADNYLYGAVQDAAAKLVHESGAITCASTKK